MKSPLRSFWSGLAAGALVTAGLLGTWFAASFDVTTGTWLEVEGDIRESSRESIRLKPQPASDSAQEAVSRAAPARASPVQRPLDKKSQRDAHFENLLDSLASRQRQEAFDTIFVDNVWGNAESRSGDGSSELYTRNARTLLAHAIQEYGVKDWIDSPCGDCNWQGLVEGIDDVAYLGLDIVPGYQRKCAGLIAGNKEKYANRTNMNFKQQDFINEPFPHTPDMILCRDMIQHNALVDGVRAYYNMEKSGAKYLATTWHQQGDDIINHNHNVAPGGMYPVNVFLHPFNFSKPEFFIREGVNQPDQKTLGLFKLPVIGMGDGQPFVIPDELYVKAEHEIVFLKDFPTAGEP